MKLKFCKIAAMVFLAANLFTACSKDKESDSPSEEKVSKYVLITMSENTLTKPGYATVFDALPSGSVSNTTANSLQGMGFGGWRPYNNWLLKMFNTSANELGIERLKITDGTKVATDAFIKAADQTTNGGGNFVILDDTKGFYFDGSAPKAIQTFNPTTLARTGQIDLTAAVDERGSAETGIKYRSIGQKFLAVKNGKLYANITYATTDGTQKGFWDDFYSDVYIAVIDIATAKWEKTIKIDDTGSIAYINDNNMYDFDTNGDLYIVTQGRSAVGGKSKIVRIKASETDIDATWSLNMDEIFADGGKFVTVFVKDGKLITTVPNAKLTGGPTGNINFAEVWDFYSFDVATKVKTKITGISSVTNPGAAFGTIELDGKILLRVNTPSQNINGYYQLNGTAATQVFNVTAGGSVTGLYKVTL